MYIIQYQITQGGRDPSELCQSRDNDLKIVFTVHKKYRYHVPLSLWSAYIYAWLVMTMMMEHMPHKV